MFNIGNSEHYSWPVKVELAGDGKPLKHSFDAQFKRLPASEITALGEQLTKGDISEDALVRQILTGWAGVQDADGSDLPFSERSRDLLMDIFPVRGCVITAWLDSLKVGRAKN